MNHGDQEKTESKQKEGLWFAKSHKAKGRLTQKRISH